MSYRLDLDEYPAATLRQELRARRRTRNKGLCDYCARPPYTPSCKFPERHKVQAKPKERLLIRFAKFLRDRNVKVGVMSVDELLDIISAFRKLAPL